MAGDTSEPKDRAELAEWFDESIRWLQSKSWRLNVWYDRYNDARLIAERLTDDVLQDIPPLASDGLLLPPAEAKQLKAKIVSRFEAASRRCRLRTSIGSIPLEVLKALRDNQLRVFQHIWEHNPTTVDELWDAVFTDSLGNTVAEETVHTCIRRLNRSLQEKGLYPKYEVVRDKGTVLLSFG